MFNNDMIDGWLLVDSETPVWEPLRDLVGMELADWFMWMGEIELADGESVHAYKHITTRRYLHLAAGEEQAFAYIPDRRYRPISGAEAIDEAFRNWDTLRPEPEPEAPDAVRAELARVREAAVARAREAA